MKTSYSIGEFSRVTGLSVKTLRFYHEKGLLLPSSVDDATGYRFYDAGKVEKARVILRLREMEFSLEDIAAVLGQCDDEADILGGRGLRTVLSDPQAGRGGRHLHPHPARRSLPDAGASRALRAIGPQLREDSPAGARERKLEIVLPTREVYVKGPGMIFKGNPKNYLTEIQLPIGG